jgi:hypothetical protein
MTTHETTHEKRLDLIRRIQTEGAEAAYQAALAVCQDPKAPAPARATCATTILRAGGYLMAKDDLTSAKQPHEMSPQELQERIDWLRSRQSIGFADGEDEGPEGVFG